MSKPSDGRGKETTSGRSLRESSSGSRSLSSKDDSKRQLKIVTKAPTERTNEMRASLKEGANINKREIYDNVCEWENNEAKKLDEDTMLKHNLEVCAELELIMNQIRELKDSGKTDTPEYSSQKLKGMMLLTKLRQTNRFFKIKLRIAKDDILTKRQEVDSDHLLLQNLIYEATHLTNQVAIVQDYKGKDEQINLIPEEQFFGEAPPEISKPELTKDNPYLLRIARLEYEFVQRQKLTAEVKALEKEKKDMTALVNEQQANLSSIRPLLTTILESTKPAQKFFNIDLSERKVMYNLAKYLPTPLYILYSSSTGYENSTPERKGRFHASISGDMEAAKKLQQCTPVVDPASRMEVDEESDVEMEDNEAGETEESDVRKLRKRSSILEIKEDPKKKLFETHPLKVEWEIKNESSGDRVTIQFFYLTKLEVISVKSKLEITEEDGKLTEVLLHSDNILSDLFPNDNGLESPNPSTIFKLEKVGLESFSEFNKHIGKPYFWAQKISGVNVLSGDKSNIRVFNQADKALRASTFTNTFKIIRKRLINQSKLWRQLKAIELRSIPLPPEAKDLFPVKNSCTFISWEPLDWVSYKRLQSPESSIFTIERPGGGSEMSLHFKAEFERGRAKLRAFVTIDLNFPHCPPVFTLRLDVGEEIRNADNDSGIRDIEKEINIYAPEEFREWGDQLLSFQLQRLAYCMDVVLETDSVVKESAGPSEYGRDKLLMSPSRGKNFRRPFKYVPVGGGYFVHRF